MHFSEGTEGKVVIFHVVLTWAYLFIKGLSHEQTVLGQIGKCPLLLCKSFSVFASSHLWDPGCIFSEETHGILEEDI